MQQILEQAQKLPIHRPSSGSSMSIVGHLKPIRSTGSLHSNPSKLSRVSGIDSVLKRLECKKRIYYFIYLFIYWHNPKLNYLHLLQLLN